MDTIDYFRIGNSVLALVAMIWLVVDLVTRAKFLTSRRLYLTLALIGFMIAVLFGSLEQISQDVRPGFRTAFTAAACIWTLIGLYLGRDDDK